MTSTDETVKTAPAAMTTELSARPVFLLTAGRAMASAVTFVTPLVLTRVFDQAGFGTYKQLFLIGGTLAVIAQLGMAESLLYFLPSAPRRGGRYVMNALLVLGGSGLACLGLFVLSGPLLSRWLGNASVAGLSGWIGVYVLLTVPATLFEIVMTARKRYGGAGAAYGLSDLFRSVALVAPAVVTGRLEWLLAGAAAFATVRLGATLLYLGREFGAELRPDAAVLREQLAYALPFQLGGALWILVLNLHYYLVASFVNAATFAIYAVGCFQIPLVELLFTPAKNVMIVRMREAITAHRPEAAIAIWHDTVRKLALVFFPLVGLLVVTAPALIPFLFTERYAASVPIFMTWSTIILIVPIQAEGVLAAYADTRAIAAVCAVQLLLITGLVLSLMQPFGLVGAVLGTVLAMGLAKSLMLLRAKRLMRATLADLLPWRSLGAMLGAAVASTWAAFETRVHMADGALPLLVLTSSVYLATYLAILALRGLFDTETGQATTKRIRLLLGWPVNTP